MKQTAADPERLAMRAGASHQHVFGLPNLTPQKKEKKKRKPKKKPKQKQNKKTQNPKQKQKQKNKNKKQKTKVDESSMTTYFQISNQWKSDANVSHFSSINFCMTSWSTSAIRSWLQCTISCSRVYGFGRSNEMVGKI